MCDVIKIAQIAHLSRLYLLQPLIDASSFNGRSSALILPHTASCVRWTGACCSLQPMHEYLDGFELLIVRFGKCVFEVLTAAECVGVGCCHMGASSALVSNQGVRTISSCIEMAFGREHWVLVRYVTFQPGLMNRIYPSSHTYLTASITFPSSWTTTSTSNTLPLTSHSPHHHHPSRPYHASYPSSPSTPCAPRHPPPSYTSDVHDPPNSQTAR